MDLIKRFDEIDENDLNSVLAFLYREDITKYDINNLKDNYELYSFWLYFVNKLGHQKMNELIMMMGGAEKMPQILRYGAAAQRTVDHYVAIKRFTDHAIQEPVLNDIYDDILNSLKEKIEYGYVCFMKSFDVDDKKYRNPYHNFYFSHERDVVNNFAEVMMQISDAIDEDLIVRITFEKPAKKGRKAVVQERFFCMKDDRFILTEIQDIPHTKDNERK